jgi:DNA ligase-1
LENEFEIIGFHEGEGDDIGTVIWECKIDDLKIFSVKPKGSREIRRDYFLNAANYIGKKLTVIYQEMTADGIPRFPVGKEIRDYED